MHTRPCFTQMQDIHFPRTLHRQQTGPADLETPFVWPKRLSGRRPGSGDGVGGRRLPVRLRTRGDAIASQTAMFNDFCFYIRISIDSTITVYHLNPPNAIFRAIERTRKLAALAINNPFHVYSNNN